MEQINLKEKFKSWTKPKIKEEMGEIDRVAKTFSKENAELYEKIVSCFKEQINDVQLEPLTDELWSKLENTDSWDVKSGDWEKVRECTEYYNQTTGSNRSWENLKNRMSSNLELNAPIIFEKDKTYHLVSGNTRLMTAKALGVTPMVSIINYK